MKAVEKKIYSEEECRITVFGTLPKKKERKYLPELSDTLEAGNVDMS